MENWLSKLHSNPFQVLFVYGIDLDQSYHDIEEWLNKDNDNSFVLLDDSLVVIDQFLKSDHGKHLLSHPHAAVHHLSEQLSELDRIILPYSFFPYSIVHKIHGQYNEQRYAEIKAMIAFFANYHRSSILGYSQGAIYFFNNYFKNILKLPSSHNGHGLYNQFKGIPAIICGAGPSLDKNVDILSKLQSRALIFAGATGVNALNAKGIVPHIGVGIDPNPEQLTRLMMNEGPEMPFFYRNRIYHKVLDKIHADKTCFLGSPGFGIATWFEKKLGLSIEPLGEGFNVLNFAVSLAYEMGCNPIIMVGVDLAYSRGQSYAADIKSHPLYNKKNNFKTKSSDEEILNKKDVYGHPTRTLWKWIRESLWYGLFAEEHPDVLLLNCTEGGIGFPGIENKTLTEVAAQYLIQHYNLALRLHGETQNSSWPKEVKHSQILALMGEIVESLKRCGDKYQQIENELSSEIESSQILISKLNEEIKSEVAFYAMLENIEESSFRFTSLERQRLKEGENTLAKNELISRQKKLDLAHYGLLKKAAYSNASLVNSIIEDDAKKHFKLTTSNPVHENKEHVHNSIYLFKDQCLTIHDPELDISYSESFPQETYLRKEKLLYPDGAVKLEQFYQGMLLHGPSTFFSNEGKVLGKSWFLNGQQHGRMHTYFKNGQKHSEQAFRFGQKHGPQTYFYPDGSLKTLLYYRHGRLHSDKYAACSLYYNDGHLAREQYFIEGQLEGLERFWYENGQLEIQANYHQNLPLGLVKKWHSNGQLASEVSYDLESKRVYGHYWDINGNPVSEEKDHQSYFETVSQHANLLTDSLGDVFTNVKTLIPSLFEAKSASTQEKEPDFSAELKDLQQEMEKLQELSKALKQESSQDNAQECGIDPKTQAAFEQQLLLKHRKMTDHMQSIDHGFKDMLKGLLQKNEDDEK